MLGGTACAVDVRDAREVVTLEAWTRVPGAPPALLGVMNLRGTVLPVVEARPLLGVPAPALTPGTPAVVIADGAYRAAIAVERVLGLESYDDVRPAPDGASPFVQGALAGDHGTVSLLDAPRLLASLRAAWARKDA